MTTVERLDTRARGIVDGHAPVPRVLPGEVLDLTGDKPRILSPSDHRVAPPCRHAKACGGCALQHASEAFTADWKRNVIVTGLKAQGLETEIKETLTSPAQSRRRAVLHGRRTKSGAQLGFLAPQSDVLIDTPDCLLLSDVITKSRPALLALTQALCSRKGQIDLAVTATDTGLDVDIRADRLPDDAETTIPALAEQFKLARVSHNGQPIAQREAPELSIGAARVQPPPGAFLQATEHGEKALTQGVLAALGGAKTVTDLFSGCGTFTFPTLEQAQVSAIESDPALIAALDKGWRMATGLKALKTETRDLFRRPLLPDELNRFDAVIIDPPRAGAEAQTRELAKSAVSKIAAVSCNPVTFARDAKILTDAGYSLYWVQPVDQFRWSAHVELVAAFRRL